MIKVQNKRRHIILSVLLIMIFLSSNFTGVFAAEKPEFVRVGLKYISASVSSCQITGEANLALWNFQGEENWYVLSDVKAVTVSVSGGVLSASGTNKEELYYLCDGVSKKVSEALTNGYALVSSDYLNYLNATTKSFNSIVKYDGKAYRGGMSFYMNANDTIHVINRLSIDEYTYGVINGEMGYSNPMEALKAQAVAARSYALTNKGKHGSSGYDLCDSTHCQVYKGYTDENIKTNQAVDETRNLGIYYENSPVSAFFSKNSGGYTQNVEDVWNSKIGYLRGVKDPYSPVYNWKSEFTFSELESKLRVAGYDIGTLKSVAITSKNMSGAVATLEFTGTKGKATIMKEKIRTILGMSIIKSTMFSINKDEKFENVEMFLKGNNLSNLAGEKIYVLNSSGKTVELDKGSTFLINDKCTSVLSGKSKETLIVTEEPVVFSGVGSGHGIGLPQDSAIEMAKQGFTFREILNFFYTDIEIK